MVVVTIEAWETRLHSRRAEFEAIFRDNCHVTVRLKLLLRGSIYLTICYAYSLGVTERIAFIPGNNFFL
jgi:hypothetical protein